LNEHDGARHNQEQSHDAPHDGDAAARGQAIAMQDGNVQSDQSRRRHALLIAAVQDFIATAEPIGSHHIASRYRLGVKAATVRSMMAELEEEGYLFQPHTSAGRIPTDKGFRYYVDDLRPRQQLGMDDRARIEMRYSEAARDTAETMRETSRLLAMLTGQAAVVLAPRLEAVVLQSVNFVRVRAREVLAIFVALAGGVEHRLINIEHDYAQDELDRMGRYLDEVLGGRTLEEARGWIEQSLHEERARYDSFVRAALKLGDAMMSRPAVVEVYVEGSARAVEQPEFADPAKMQELLRALEDKTALLDLLERSLRAAGPMISIGSENIDPRLGDLSVVAAAYAGGSKPLGTLAIVGPVRMDYGRVIPLVDYIARTLSRLFEP
jgi:heat-inducible transcriptional repressor